MKISVITVTYNCINTIEATINSVLSQNYDDYEYIIIDGGSTDGTYDVIKKYSDRLSYYISEPDDGIYDAMNKGLKVALGDLVLFLNGDDRLSDDQVFKRIENYYVDDKTIIIGRVQYGNRISENLDGKELESNYYGIFYPHQATFVPKPLYEQLGGFDEQYKVSADFDWICRAIYNACKIKWVDELVSVFALGGVSASLQCVIDEYNISKKYMSLTFDKNIENMTYKTKEKAMTYFFRRIFKEDKYVDNVKGFMADNGFKKGDKVQLWGAGFWAPLFIELFSKCNIEIDYIIDSQSTRSEMSGIPIGRYDRTRVSFVMISTEDYDDEVVDILRNEGFRECDSFISFHRFRNAMLGVLDRDMDEYRYFVECTGLVV